MRLQHFEILQPVCPRCLHQGALTSPLTLEAQQQVDDPHGNAVITSGRLLCSNSGCQQEFPIIDGVPLLVPNVREYVQAYQTQLLQRSDLYGSSESLIGDCLGPDALFNQTRQYLSTYAADGYGEFEQPEPGPASSSAALLAKLDRVAGDNPRGHLLDMGCATGRTSIDIATAAGPRADELVLGVDQQFAMIQFAQRLLQQGTADYPLRSVGLVYENKTVHMPAPLPANLDFWVCDAAAPPFADATFGTMYGLNLLDSVADPTAVLAAAAGILHPGASLRLATPFEWSSQVTAPDRWIGGHSQRSDLGGNPVAVLQSLIGRAELGLDGLRIVAEKDGLCWQTRITDRSSMQYQAYAQVLERL
ncbi:MAG: methyltransferase domain-containing protein [Pseudomonadales bacterium]